MSTRKSDVMKTFIGAAVECWSKEVKILWTCKAKMWRLVGKEHARYITKKKENR